MMHRWIIRNIITLSLTITLTITTQDNAPRGIRNLGDTCYLNSTIQILCNTPEINDRLHKAHETLSNFPNNELLSNIAFIVANKDNPLYDNSRDERCKRISRYMQRETQSMTEQQDPTELLNKVIYQLDNYDTHAYNIDDLFNISCQSDIRSPETQTTINTPETHASWPLNIGPFAEDNAPTQSCSVPYMINTHTFKPDSIEYRDEHTGYVYHDAEKHDTIVKLPQYVTMQVTPRVFTKDDHRQQLAGHEPTGSPINIAIDIPEYIRITHKQPVTARHHRNSTTLPIASQHTVDSHGGKAYRLRNAIIYSGKGSSGHYWAYVRNGNTWYTCNDAVVFQENFPNTWYPLTGASPYFMMYERYPSHDTTWWDHHKPLILGTGAAATIITAIAAFDTYK